MKTLVGNKNALSEMFLLHGGIPDLATHTRVSKAVADHDKVLTQ